MGDNFVKKVTDRFKHAQDLAYQRMQTPDLFSSQPEVFARTYDCELRVPDLTFADSQLIRVCLADDGTLETWVANRVVGHVTDADKDALVTALHAAPNAGGSLLAVVVEQSPEFGDFSIRCVEDVDDE